MLQRLAVVCLVLSSLVAPAGAQDLAGAVQEGTGPQVKISVENPLDFDVTVIGFRVTIKESDDEELHYFSTTPVSQALAPGASWSGELTFAAADGTAPDEYVDWGNYDRVSVAAAVDIDAFAGPIEAAIASRDWDQITAQMPILRARLPIVSRTARFHEAQVTASGMDARRYFDLARLDALRDGLEDAICDIASREVLGWGGSADAQQDRYNELSERIRGVGLHINCINGEAKLAAARMLLRSSRPQDALLFKEVDESGQLLPEWRPVFIEANLALARTAAELDVRLFTAIEPALRALAEVRTLDPENADLRGLADKLIPNAAQWVIEKSGPMDRDIESAMECLSLIRPMWSSYPVVERAASAFAVALLEEGLRFCERREYVNSRNRFIRGENMLAGIPEWEARAAEINHCRALGSLEEGRELANHPTDNEGPVRGFEKLAEAEQRFDLTDEEVASFKTDIASAWVSVALRQLAESPPAFEAATHSLGEAEAMNPAGRTGAMRSAWITFAERMHETDGFAMTGARVERAREALANAEGAEPERVASIAGKLTMTYYGYRVGIPALVVAAALCALMVRVGIRRRTRRLVEASEA